MVFLQIQARRLRATERWRDVDPNDTSRAARTKRALYRAERGTGARINHYAAIGFIVLGLGLLAAGGVSALVR